MKRLIISVIVLMVVLVGCVSFEHTQSMVNLTGASIAEVYTRPAGTGNWGNVRNVQPRRDSNGQVIRRADGSVAFWDRFTINNGGELLLFSRATPSEDAPSISNHDIRVVDSNGFWYTKYNVPISFTTTSRPMFGSRETVRSSQPIAFTVADRHPVVNINNTTGFQAVVGSPFTQLRAINNGASTIWMSPELNPNRNIQVTYTVGRMQYTANVFVGNDDAVLALTGRPPTITVMNQTGARIDYAHVRNSGQLLWGNNLLSIQFDPHDGSVIHGHVTTVPNTQPFHVWTGNLELAAGTIDIRFDDVNGNVFIINGVSLGNEDIRLTVTQAHNTAP